MNVNYLQPMQQHLLAATSAGDIRIFNLFSGAEENSYQVHESYIYHMQVIKQVCQSIRYLAMNFLIIYYLTRRTSFRFRTFFYYFPHNFSIFSFHKNVPRTTTKIKIKNCESVQSFSSCQLNFVSMEQQIFGLYSLKNKLTQKLKPNDYAQLRESALNGIKKSLFFK